jgi:signal transduction histidine kinase
MIERVEHTLLQQKSFLADSSHELRRPLTVLRTNIDILGQRELTPEERDRCVEEIRAEAQIMGKLLADLLLLAREDSQAVERAPVDLSQLCEGALVRLPAGHGHEVIAEIEPGIEVLGDRERLEQMVNNLLENAIQYSPNGEAVELSLNLSNGHALLEIADKGLGIDEGELDLIFERFYRGLAARESRPDGTGLGLSIVKYVAQAHRGTISVVSRPGEGTRFAVRLPLRRGQFQG